MQQTFAYLILYPTTLLNSLIHFIDSLGFHLWIDLFLSNLYAFFFLALLHWLEQIFTTMLNRNPCLVHPISGKAFRLLPLSILIADFFCMQSLSC